MRLVCNEIETQKDFTMPIAAHQQTPSLGLPYIMPGQALSYITHNEALKALDVRVQTRVVSRAMTAPPENPDDGSGYIVPDPQGDWESPSGSLMRYQYGGYSVYPPEAGWQVWVEDEAQLVVFNGTEWERRSGGEGDLGALSQLGINATADATNRLAVSSDATLLTHAGSSHRCVVNKSASEATASFLFQNDFQGHAEFGLIGSNDFSLKVSGNGQVFNEVFHVDPWTANLRLPDGQQLEFDVASGNKSGVSYIRTRQGNMSFEKPTSDETLSDGTAFVFVGCGGQNSGNPFWQGLQLTSTVVTRDGATFLPRTSLYWRFTNKEDPDDLSFVFKNTAGGLNADITFVPAGEGAFIADTITGMRVGPDIQPIEAMLDVQGAVRMKTYTLATLPAGQGGGSVAMVSDAVGGMAMVFFDGTVWRTVHDRQTV